jgi:hypothetical protein
MDIRQLPTRYGSGSGVAPEKLLGDHEFDAIPQPGQRLAMHGETWIVVEVHDDWLYVTPAPER